MNDNRNIYGSNDCGGYDGFELERKQSKTNKIIIIIVASIVLYILFLYMGYSTTTFKTNDDGSREALVVNIEDRKGQEDYKKLKTYYNELHSLMEECKIMQENIENGEYDSFTYATSYKEILTKVDSYMSAIQVATINEKYVDIKKSLLSSFNAFAIYCQKMDTALTNDSYEQYVEAESWKKNAEDNFEILSGKFLDFGHTIQIYEDPDLAWYEEKLAYEKLYGETEDETEKDNLIEIKGEDTEWKEGGLRDGTNIHIEQPTPTPTQAPDAWLESIMDGNKENTQNGGYGQPISGEESGNAVTTPVVTPEIIEETTPTPSTSSGRLNMGN